MRVLVTSTPGWGHVHPLVPVAELLRDAGHEVVWATAGDARDRVGSLGYRTLPAGMDLATRRARLLEGWPDAYSLPPRQRRPVLFTALFATLGASQAIQDLPAVFDEVRPDLVVHDAAELAAAPLASARGVPHMAVGFGAPLPSRLIDGAAEPIGRLWDSVGLEPAPAAGLYEHLYLHPLPRSLGDIPDTATIRFARPSAFDDRDVAPPDWIEGLGTERPLAYITFGTEFTPLAPIADVFEAVGRIDLDAVLTVGPHFDPRQLGPAPSNLRVERFVPQRFLLEHASVVVSHAGSGTMIGAALAGLPHVCLPIGADQFDNADALATSGAGIVLEPSEVDADAVTAAIRRAIDSREPAECARQLAEDFAALPELASHLPTIEALVAA